MEKGFDSYNDSASDGDVETNAQYTHLQAAIDRSDLSTVFSCPATSNFLDKEEWERKFWHSGGWFANSPLCVCFILCSL